MAVTIAGDINCVQWLVEDCNADISCARVGKTPLMYAVELNKREILNYLIKQKADVNAVEKPRSRK